MKFVVQPGLISFSDDRPGAHATMFAPSGKLAFRDDVSSFNDSERSYTWAFAYEKPLKKGDVFVFTTSDREAVGEVDAAGAIQVSDRKVTVSRTESGATLKVKVKTKWFG